MSPMELLLEQERNDKRYWLREDEAQDLTKRCRTTMWKYRRDKILDYRKDGDNTRYLKASVYAYVRERILKEPVMVAKIARRSSELRLGR
jgi:hypothetical protein